LYQHFCFLDVGKVKSDPVTGRVVAQKVDRGIALPFHDRGSRKVWVVSSTPRLYFTHGKDPVPIVQEAGWAPGPVCPGGKSRPTGLMLVQDCNRSKFEAACVCSDCRYVTRIWWSQL